MSRYRKSADNNHYRHRFSGLWTGIDPELGGRLRNNRESCKNPRELFQTCFRVRILVLQAGDPGLISRWGRKSESSLATHSQAGELGRVTP